MTQPTPNTTTTKPEPTEPFEAGGTMPMSFIPTLRSQWLGEQLRALRQQRRMSLKETALHLGRDWSALARYERAEWPIRRADTVTLLDLYGQHGTTARATMLHVAETIWHQHLWDTAASPYPDTDASVISTGWLAGRAERLHVYQPALDTAALDALMPWVHTKPVEAIIADTSTAEHQFRHLAKLKLHTGLDLRFLPARAALDHSPGEPFTVFVMPKPYPPVAYQNGLAGRLVIEGQPAHLFAETYRRLQTVALSPAASDRSVGLATPPPGSQ